jgi:HSP20 family protein
MPNRELAPRRGSGQLSQPGWDPFTSFRREMDRLFDDFLSPAEPRSFAGQGVTTWPSVDVEETKNGYRLTAELPGIEERDVELELRDNALKLSGEKRCEYEEGEGQRAYSERSYGRFERTIPLGPDIDQEKVEARFRNGVLTVELPRRPDAQPASRRIEIKPQ